MVKVIWTESALTDQNDIGEYIAKDSVRYAELTVTNLFESSEILETHPKAGVKQSNIVFDLGQICTLCASQKKQIDNN